MKIHFDVRNAASGTFFRVSGARRPDCYLFERKPGGIHRLTIDGKNLAEITKDIGLRTTASPEILTLTIELEDADRIADTRLNDLLAQVATLTTERDRLAGQLIQAKAFGAQQAPEPELARVTDEELGFLRERDLLIDVLGSAAHEMETPFDTAVRLTGYRKSPTGETPPADQPEPPPKPAEPPTGKSREEREAELRRILRKTDLLAEAERIGLRDLAPNSAMPVIRAAILGLEYKEPEAATV